MIEQLATATDDELLAEVVELEAELSRVRYRQVSVLAELKARNVAGVRGYRGLAQLLAEQVRCALAEARKRAVAVERFGPAEPDRRDVGADVSGHRGGLQRW